MRCPDRDALSRSGHTVQIGITLSRSGRPVQIGITLSRSGCPVQIRTPCPDRDNAVQIRTPCPDRDNAVQIRTPCPDRITLSRSGRPVQIGITLSRSGCPVQIGTPVLYNGDAVLRVDISRSHVPRDGTEVHCEFHCAGLSSVARFMFACRAGVCMDVLTIVKCLPPIMDRCDHSHYFCYSMIPQ